MSDKKEWKETKVSLSGAIIGGAVTLVLGLLVGLNWETFAPYLGFASKNSSRSFDWSALNEVYYTLTANYDGTIDNSAIIEGAKKGIADSLGDIYTVYMTASEAKDFNASLHGDVGAGIGVEMGLRDGYVRVIRILPDNPAGKAGILVGDIIYKVGGEEVYTKTTDEISQRIRGTEGTEVTVTVVRDGKELDFTMKREVINNVSAYVDYRGTTAIITVLRFDTNTGTLVQKLAKDFASKNIDKVILDLRNNGGGYTDAARDLLSLWLDGEKVFTQKSIHTIDEVTYALRGKATLSNIKTVVLVNESTASASEIVTGALKDYGKATIVGKTTFGKGVAQNLIDLSGGSQLKVTAARWYTPNDTSINGVGITPDIEVDQTYDDINAGRDPQMDAALAL